MRGARRRSWLGLPCRGARRSRRRILPQPGWDGAFRAVCVVARLANGACHWRRLASRIPSRKASVATARDLFRGSQKLPGSLLRLAQLCYSELRNPHVLAVYIPVLELLAPRSAGARDGSRAAFAE